MCYQQGRTDGIATRLYVDSGLAGISSRDDERGPEWPLVIRIEGRDVRRYPCSGCGRRTVRVRSTRERTWDGCLELSRGTAGHVEGDIDLGRQCHLVLDWTPTLTPNVDPEVRFQGVAYVSLRV